MRPLRTRLEEARKRLGIPWEVLERDYLLSWVLAGIGQVESLRKSLVFKGGTALKKCYFGDYRFSEDLDFSCMEGAPMGVAMEDAIGQACSTAAAMLDEYAPVEISWERYTEDDVAMFSPARISSGEPRPARSHPEHRQGFFKNSHGAAGPFSSARPFESSSWEHPLGANRAGQDSGATDRPRRTHRRTVLA